MKCAVGIQPVADSTAAGAAVPLPVVEAIAIYTVVVSSFGDLLHVLGCLLLLWRLLHHWHDQQLLEPNMTQSFMLLVLLHFGFCVCFLAF